MALILDLIILAVFLVIVILDTKRGFVKAFLHMISSIVALVVAYAFTPLVGGLIRDGWVIGGIKSGIASTLRSLVGTDAGTYNLEKLFSNSFFTSIAERYGADMAALQETAAGQTAADTSAVDLFAEKIAGPVAGVISNVLAFLILFIGTLLLVRLATFILDKLAQLPAVESVNRFFGFLLGLLTALIVAWALSMAVSFLMTALGALDAERFGAGVIEDTVLVRILSKYNLLAMFRGLFQ